MSRAEKARAVFEALAYPKAFCGRCMTTRPFSDEWERIGLKRPKSGTIFKMVFCTVCHCGEYTFIDQK